MESRTVNAQRNIISAILFQGLNIILKFGLRTVFIYTLGEKYLGINDVFYNILSLLSLSELGIGTAIIYDMYKPISQGDYARVKSLFAFYKTIYKCIGLFIFMVGCCLIPFLDSLVTEVPNVEHIYLIYILCVINSAGSYFFAEYTSLINAYQKNYLINKVQIIFSIVKTVVESLLLLLFHTYLLYLTVEIVLILSQNICIRTKARQLFPYIKTKGEALSSDDRKKIYQNAFSNFSIKISGTVINSTPNLLISALISTALVGIYSNYAMIIQIIWTSAVLIMNAVMPGVGNVCASDSAEKKRQIFMRLNFLFTSVYALVFVVYLNAIEPFVRVWIGNKYVLSAAVELMIILNCVIVGFRQVSEIFVSTDGLFRYFRVVPILTMVINLTLSVLLARWLGLFGILAGTVVGQLVTNAWFYPYIVCKYSLQMPFRFYLLDYGKSTLLIVLSVIASYLWIKPLTQRIQSDVLILFVSALGALLTFTLIWVLFYAKNQEFHFYQDFFIQKIQVWKRRGKST